MTHPAHKGHENDERMQKPRGGQAMVIGGINWPAAFTGWAIAFLSGLILSAITGAVLTALGTTTPITGLGIAGGIVGLIVWFIAFLIGGWTASRIAGFNGLLQGFMVWIIGLVFIVLLLILAAVLGPGVALIGGISIPAVGNLAAAVGIGSVILLIVELIGALLGGWLATRTQRMM